MSLKACSLARLPSFQTGSEAAQGAGSLDAKARLSGDPARKALAADLAVTTSGLVTGIQAADRTLGRAPTLQGRVSQTFDGYGFDHLRLEGAGVAATLQGEATASRADVTGRLDLRSLADLDGRLTGKASIDARLTGSLEHPDVTAALTAPSATAAGKPIRDLRAEAVLRDALLAPDGTVRLSGDVDGKALTGGAHLARVGGDWVLDRLGLDLGSVAVAGHAMVAADTWLSAGALTVLYTAPVPPRISPSEPSVGGTGGAAGSAAGSVSGKKKKSEFAPPPSVPSPAAAAAAAATGAAAAGSSKAPSPVLAALHAHAHEHTPTSRWACFPMKPSSL